MNLRITTQTQLRQQISNLRAQTDQIAQLQQQASTGKRLIRPSDDPMDVAVLLRNQETGRRIETGQSNVKSAEARLNGANAALLDAEQVLAQGKQLALAGADGTLNASDRANLATEADELVKRLLSQANTTIDGRYVFGGTATDAEPFAVTARDASGRITAVAYQGAQDDPVALAYGQSFEIGAAGDRVFTRTGRDAFVALIGLRDDLLDGSLTDSEVSAALNQRLGELDQAQENVLGTVGDLSGGLASLQNLGNRLLDLDTQTQVRIGELEGADLADVVVRLTTQQTLLSSTLAVSARISDQTLLDFIR